MVEPQKNIRPSNLDGGDKKRAVRILAKSLYRDLTAQGFDDKQVVALATELLGEVTQKRPTPAQS